MARALRSSRAQLLLLLGVSCALRVVLVLKGGQLYFGDERRFLRAWGLLFGFVDSGWRRALDLLLRDADHSGFTLLGCLPALVQLAWMRLLEVSTDLPGIVETLWASQLVFALASVACIGLVYAIALRAGADAREAIGAAGLLACSNALFYWSRHAMPYDASLCLVLLALWIGLHARPGFGRSLASGLAAGSAFLVYNGYWASALIVGAFLVLRQLSDPHRAGIVAAGFGLGIAGPLALLTGISWVWQTGSYPERLIAFSQTVVQGEFSEGAALPFHYLWHAEHGLAGLFSLAAVGTLVCAMRPRSPQIRRALGWLAIAASLYGTMALLSTVLEQLVVLARQVRQLIPFLCLMTAAVGASLLRGRRTLGLALAVAIVGQAAFNFAAPLAQAFPAGVFHRTIAEHRDLKRGLSVGGPPLRWSALWGLDGREAFVADRPPRRASRWLLLNAQYLFPLTGAEDAPLGRLVWSTPHPAQYIPYQYEGYTPSERDLLRSADISMRLIQLPLSRPRARGDRR